MAPLKLLLILLLLAWLAALAAIWLGQTAILFPVRQVAPAEPLPDGVERLVVKTADGESLHGVHLALARGSQGAEPPPIILGFGGNAWNAESAAAYLHGLYPNAEIVAFHFRGYGPSTGAPGAAALLADAPLIHDEILRRYGQRPVVAVGFSIGSGIAVHLASRRRLAGLILVTPFDSLERLAQDHMRWLPVGLLLRHRMEPADDLRGVSVPVALIAAERDTIVPAERTAGLRAAAAELVLDRTIKGAGHNDIYQRPEFREAMAEALFRIERGGGAGRRS